MKRNYDYPEETEGSKLAAEIRAKCNKLSRKERMKYLRLGMKIINNGK